MSIENGVVCFAIKPSRIIKALLPVSFLLFATGMRTCAWAQVQVTVPGNASGHFGNNADLTVPFVPAITVNWPSTITVKYVNGTVTDCCGVNTGPNGVLWNATGAQTPLDEAVALPGGETSSLDALIGVFVDQRRTSNPLGFKAIDGTKNPTAVGIAPDLLFFIGEGTTYQTTLPGTLYLGINDWYVSDNGGAFVVDVSATAESYNPAAQFSATTNPNGTWSYGWSQTRGSAFSLYNEKVAVGAQYGWTAEIAGISLGGDFDNPTDSPITHETTTDPANGVIYSPGPQGQNAVVRWTSPAAGQVAVKASFFGVDFVGPTTSDVAVLHNNVQLFASYINGYGPSSEESYSGTLTVAVGDTIDFTCGYGDNGNYYYDTTALNMSITPQ